MKKTELLNEILSVLQIVKNDEDKLKQLHRFIMEEIYEDSNIDTDIPTRYKVVVSKVADELTAGFICYINTRTLEFESFPKEMILDREFFEVTTGESIDEYEYKHLQWEKYITIEPLSSR